jgi:hypothetical protein
MEEGVTLMDEQIEHIKAKQHGLGFVTVLESKDNPVFLT